MTAPYIHGSTDTERARLALMNDLINPRCLEALQIDHEQRVLDVGAGTGQFTRLIADRLPPPDRVVAVERDPAQIAAAVGVAGDRPEMGGPVEFRQGEAQQLPLQDEEWGTFDLAHARFVLEHVPDPERIVAGMVASVRPGGRVVLLDDDHEVMRFGPDTPALDAAWSAYWRSYRTLGCDPLIGRRLVSLLHGAGARPVRAEQVFYGACAGEPAFNAVVDNLAGVLAGAREAVLAAGQISAAAYDQGLDELTALASKPDGVVWYVINLAEGRRVGSDPERMPG
ncbi:methyltransferase domain-containing protein [Elongatibacter sediminis]|uniref:Methyltransferase domain-containing protein n=1 Tax=Elongatibacter sediminis TaxID=3119006 RepID=A0AAW9RDI0_9GAMM